MRLLSTAISLTLLSVPAQAGEIIAPPAEAKPAAFDVLRAKVSRQGTHLVFEQEMRDRAGARKPTKTGKLAGASVHAYVWPTSLDSGVIGFEEKQGVVALAVTAHGDFDDTPLYDEDNDGDPKNDGGRWHSHWVVLVPDVACKPGALKVKDIPAGAKPRLPKTWPELPLLIDSPGYEPSFGRKTVTVRVPLKEIGFAKGFKFDGVTAGLRVNGNLHAPLLCVVDVFKVASGNLSLPGSAD